MMSTTTAAAAHHAPNTSNASFDPMNTSERGNAMEDSSRSTSPLHHHAHQASPTKSSQDDDTNTSDSFMGGLFSQEYMSMEKPSIVLQQPFQFGNNNMEGDVAGGVSTSSKTGPGGGLSPATNLKPSLNTTVSYCNLFESYSVEPLPSSSTSTQMACISEGEDDSQSQSNKSHGTNGSVIPTSTDCNTSSETMGSTTLMTASTSFVMATSRNPSFIASAPSFVASVHDPWATLSDRSSIITAAAATAIQQNGSKQKNVRKDSSGSTSSSSSSNDSSTTPDKKRSRVQLTEQEGNVKQQQQHPPPSCRVLRKRHAEKGAFTFRENGEYELMMHVQRGLPTNFNTLSPIESSNLILNVVDVYCQEEQWMFHIGQDKGKVLKGFLQECLTYKKQQEEQQANKLLVEEEGEESSQAQEPSPLILVEVGTYCGYSAILLAKSLAELDPNRKFHIYTVETNSQNIMVASSMILMSKFQKQITILHHQPSSDESLAALLKRKIKTDANTTPAVAAAADFVFFDHDKEQYLDHLRELEVNRIVQKGTFVAADNVLFHRLDGYRHHMTKLQRRGITKTKMVQVSLEYCDEEDDCRDGIELTSYLKNPIRRRP